MMRRLAAPVLLALLVPIAVSAAEWGEPQIEVPSIESVSRLGTSGQPAVVDAAGGIHLVHQSSSESQELSVVHVYRAPGGTWGEPERVSTPGVGARNASSALGPDGRLHVVWENLETPEGDIAHRVRGADGTWGVVTSIFPAPNFSRDPVCAVDSFNLLHVVWIDGRTGAPEIDYSTLDPAGNWSDPVSLHTTAISPTDPFIDADGLGTVHIVWNDRGTSGDERNSWDILYTQLDPETGTIPSPTRLVDHAGAALRPYLEVLPDATTHLVWLDDRDPGAAGVYFEVYYKRFLPGLGWGHDKRFTYDGHDHARPILTQGAGNTLNIAYEDYRFGNPEIFYRQVTPEFGWDPSPTRLTFDNNASQAPAIVSFPDGRLVLFWTDGLGSGNFRVFSKEGVARNTP